MTERLSTQREMTKLALIKQNIDQTMVVDRDKLHSLIVKNQNIIDSNDFNNNLFERVVNLYEKSSHTYQQRIRNKPVPQFIIYFAMPHFLGLQPVGDLFDTFLGR